MKRTSASPGQQEGNEYSGKTNNHEETFSTLVAIVALNHKYRKEPCRQL